MHGDTLDTMMLRDMDAVVSFFNIPWDMLRGKSILVTGATGLIGYNLVNCLLYANKIKSLSLTVLSLVRDKDKASRRFASWKEEDGLIFVQGSVESLPAIKRPVNYIIHGANQTASWAFAQEPVETILMTVCGVRNLLDLAKEQGVNGMVYLSSMEVYGFPKRGHKVTEDEIGALNPLVPRNSYPISKLQSENLCCAYAAEYGAPVRIVRLTQTFGSGVKYDDARVFAYFGRCACEKRDIELRTKGETERSYLYTADAVTAILTVLLHGADGAAYNAADETTYCSISEMAERVAARWGLRVRYEVADSSPDVFLPPLYMNLDTTRIRTLGWRPLCIGAGDKLIRMFENMTESWRAYGNASEKCAFPTP